MDAARVEYIGTKELEALDNPCCQKLKVTCKHATKSRARRKKDKVDETLKILKLPLLTICDLYAILI